MRAFQHLKADNDANGNPQRLYMVYELVEDDQYPFFRLDAVYDEGYHGMPAELRHMAEIPSIEIDAGQYRGILAIADGAKLRRWGE